MLISFFFIIIILYRYLNETGEVQFKRSNITHLVEHPLQMRPPSKHRNNENYERCNH